MSDPLETLDWQGNEINCSTCENAGLLAGGGCKPMQACVHDRYAKRIYRFFAKHPDLAQRYVAHPYFEVRAVASKYLGVFHLSRLRNDPDETVRSMVVLRLPQRQLLEMRNDPDREVRIRVASKLSPHDLEPMMHDEDYFVRTVVAKRLPKGMLALMMHDPDSSVRQVV